MKENHVYFIVAENGLIKIGMSNDPLKRLSVLKTMSPLKLRIITTRKGGRKLELRLHRQFQHLHNHGEWFLPGRDLVKWLKRHKFSEIDNGSSYINLFDNTNDWIVI